MAYTILSLDGGGSWALIEVHALIDLYGADATGHQVLAGFDMVAANSGGSLVLGGLLEDLTLGTLLDFFGDENKRRSVFSPTNSLGDKTLQALTGIGPKYSADAKLPAIAHLLPNTGNLPLSGVASGIQRAGKDRAIHLLIIGFDYDRRRAKFFRSAAVTNVPQLGTGAPTDLTLAEAIHASTDAPVNYFDGPARYPEREDRFWDGGVTGCNNPVMVAVTEAIGLGCVPVDIRALSIGTGTVVLPLADPDQAPSPYLQARAETGLVPDLKKLATAILDDPPDMATYLAHVMTGLGAGLPGKANSRIVRMSPLVTPIMDAAGNWTAPGGMTAAQFSYLAGIEMDALEQNQVDMITAFAELWIAGSVRNQPIRMNGDTLVLELGDPWYPDAKARWAETAAGPQGAGDS